MKKTLEECKKCKYHDRFAYGVVHCGYDNNMMSITVVLNPRIDQRVLSACPRDN